MKLAITTSKRVCHIVFTHFIAFCGCCRFTKTAKLLNFWIKIIDLILRNHFRNHHINMINTKKLLRLGVLRVLCGSVCMFVFVWAILSWCPLTCLVYIDYNIDSLNISYHKNHIFTRRYDSRKTIAVFMYIISCKKLILFQHSTNIFFTTGWSSSSLHLVLYSFCT